jgi:predicted Fe-Mo cluster-binding NifX family protein
MTTLLKIAMTSPNGQTLSGHAGKCPGYLVFEIADGQIVRQNHIKLSREQTLRHLEGGLSHHPEHPLHGINAFVTQGLGDGLMQRLLLDNIAVYQTTAEDPTSALKQLNLL